MEKEKKGRNVKKIIEIENEMKKLQPTSTPILQL